MKTNQPTTTENTYEITTEVVFKLTHKVTASSESEAKKKWNKMYLPEDKSGAIEFSVLEAECYTQGFESYNTESVKLISKGYKCVNTYARQCSKTRRGMNEGYCFNDGDAYFIDVADAEVYAKEIGYESLSDAYESGAYYFTEWDADEEHFYYEEDENGILHEISRED